MTGLVNKQLAQKIADFSVGVFLSGALSLLFARRDGLFFGRFQRLFLGLFLCVFAFAHGGVGLVVTV